MSTLIPLSSAALLANSLASWVWIWPGVVSIEPLFGLLPTILVAFIERPFVTKAGVTRRPLLKSIRANLITLIAGIPIAGGIWAVKSESGLYLFACVAVSITIAIELWYFQRVAKRESFTLRWQWIVLGNVLSNMLLLGIAITVRTLQVRWPELAYGLVPYQPLFALLHVSISITMVVASLAEPVINLLRNWNLLSSRKSPEKETDEPNDARERPASSVLHGESIAAAP
jgi:hypothetical protein